MFVKVCVLLLRKYSEMKSILNLSKKSPVPWLTL